MKYYEYYVKRRDVSEERLIINNKFLIRVYIELFSDILSGVKEIGSYAQQNKATTTCA